MIDFTSALEEFNIYSGSEKKKTLIYNNNRYLVKFPDPIREKNKNISYINNAYSEYIGSNIFKMIGIKTQDTILGTYNYHGKNKIVCACKSFTDDNHILYEFEKLALSTNQDEKIGTEISDIMNVLEESSHLINVLDTKDKFWDMFIVDSLIGNTNRHNGNWGFLLNKNTNAFEFSPIYDCGSCLNPTLDDEYIKNINDADIKNLAINSYSCLKINNNKINCINYLESKQNEDCNNAINRIFKKINIEDILNFIDNIESMPFERKYFYKKIIEIRYNILKKIYNSLNNN